VSAVSCLVSLKHQTVCLRTRARRVERGAAPVVCSDFLHCTLSTLSRIVGCYIAGLGRDGHQTPNSTHCALRRVSQCERSHRCTLCKGRDVFCPRACALLLLQSVLSHRAFTATRSTSRGQACFHQRSIRFHEPVTLSPE
jgi:hypothetical protein